jgi:hypothetical protein
VHGPGPGQEPGRRVFGVEAGLDGVAVELGSGGLGGQGLAGGRQELEADQVQAGDGLGDRVLDLDAGIDLEEPEPSALSPRAASTSEGGPTKARPRLRQPAASSGLSARNP